MGAEEEGQEVIFTENTAPDREIWDEKGGLIKKGAAEIAERDQDHVPEVKVLTTLGMFAVPVTAETTVGEIRQKVQSGSRSTRSSRLSSCARTKTLGGRSSTRPPGPGTTTRPWSRCGATGTSPGA